MGFNTKYEETRQQVYNIINSCGLPISTVLAMVQVLEKELFNIYQDVLKSEREQEEKNPEVAEQE